MLRDQILAILVHGQEQNVGEKLLAQRLGVTPAAIRKTIAQLRAESLSIGSTATSGDTLYCYRGGLTARAVQSGLHTDHIGRELLLFPEVGSTNTLLKRSYAHAPHGFTLIAEHQTAGRGRLGRSFLSPANDGLYLSILLRPKLPLAQLNYITILAAVSVCHAVNELCGFLPQIKWVNDILMNGHKLCGILTESSIDGETGTADFAVLGIGLNLRLQRETLPADICAVAGCLSDFCKNVPHRAALAAAILNQIEQKYCVLCAQGISPLMQQYRDLLCMRNRSVTVTGPNGSYPARALDVNEAGHLLIQTEDGVTHTLSSGEISIRL